MPFSNLGSHGMCNTLYMKAFERDYVSDDFECPGVKATKNVPVDFKMGYRERRKYVRGVFIGSVSKYNPLKWIFNLI